MSKNLDEMIRDAGIPSAEEVLLERLQSKEEENYHLKKELKQTQQELANFKRKFHKLRKDTGRLNKKSYKRDLKKYGFRELG